MSLFVSGAPIYRFSKRLTPGGNGTYWIFISNIQAVRCWEGLTAATSLGWPHDIRALVLKSSWHLALTQGLGLPGWAFKLRLSSTSRQHFCFMAYPISGYGLRNVRGVFWVTWELRANVRNDLTHYILRQKALHHPVKLFINLFFHFFTAI